MAMTLRLSDEQTAALRARAEAEGRSMQEVALTAVEEYLNLRPSRLQDAIARVSREDAELLDRLSR
jgi:predicted transcriptional regulator